MERTFSLLVACVCLAPLFFWAGFGLVWLFTKDAGGGGEDRIAYGYFGVLAGLALAGIGAVLTWYLSGRFLLPDNLRSIQIADGILVAGWLIYWVINSAQQPQRLQYDGRWAALEIEVKVANPLLNGSSIASAVSMDYIGGQNSGNFPRSEAVREEGEFYILPWATAPMYVDNWQMRVFLHNQPVLFPLDLPRLPTQSTAWSGWIPPVQYQAYVLPTAVKQGLTLRYRLRLVPSSENFH
ncbi:hypothetical protein GO730_11020 [Spirosoma sp. HMF3257]|uniref:Uncharacterized protein n=1 Tax=Spirosoma telluris TaxID=2183553 RepID=A0A327NL51_9BACT|nr:hypothetical protein [Spirosoma telluris]RAI74654.1 hypothetical protein HMF3257_10940 [Spirosoma telluris]